MARWKATAASPQSTPIRIVSAKTRWRSEGRTRRKRRRAARLARRQRGRKSRSRALSRRIAAIKFVPDKELPALYQRANNFLIVKQNFPGNAYAASCNAA